MLRNLTDRTLPFLMYKLHYINASKTANSFVTSYERNHRNKNNGFRETRHSLISDYRVGRNVSTPTLRLMIIQKPTTGCSNDRTLSGARSRRDLFPVLVHPHTMDRKTEDFFTSPENNNSSPRFHQQLNGVGGIKPSNGTFLFISSLSRFSPSPLFCFSFCLFHYPFFPLSRTPQACPAPSGPT